MLQTEITRLLSPIPGQYGVFVREVGGGDLVAIDADRVFSTASTIKVAILVELFRQAEAGCQQLDARLPLRTEDAVGGSGVLSLLDPGLRLTVRDLATLMIVLSDNTATNKLIDLVGIGAVNAGLERLGLARTRLNRRVRFDTQAPASDPLGLTTPREFGRLLEALAGGEIASPGVTEAMLAMLKQTQHRSMLPRLIPNEVDHRSNRWEVELAHKPGWIEGVRNDAGVLFLPDGRRIVICFFASDVPDARWTPDNIAEMAAARVGLAVFEHFTGAATRLSRDAT